jgi:hypothetical protein
VDFAEIDNENIAENRRKNRLTLIMLFLIFLLPVLLAYCAYFFGWFEGGKINHGELFIDEEIRHIEDYTIYNEKDVPIHGSVFETKYWWVLPIDDKICNNECQRLNLFLLRQTHVGLGKDRSRIHLLIIYPQKKDKLPEPFVTAYADFKHNGVVAKKDKTRSGKHKTLDANFIYLVDPLGNIFMRYPIIQNENEAYQRSKELRLDIRHSFKFSGLG